jgi:hypothetical protein
MSRTTSYPRSITGHAVVRLKNGHTFVGEAVYDGRVVTIDGSLRVSELVGDTRIFSYRPRRKRTVPLHIVREIVWDDDRCEC